MNAVDGMSARRRKDDGEVCRTVQLRRQQLSVSSTPSAAP